ncbi:MAG: amino acid ABC transporter permease [Clostridia bacterium]|nr:amino acid ABC transporter permease [Clostridia bacterium]MBO5913093.1 amino acid ABC transporter permease [Clostridia bacterium]
MKEWFLDIKDQFILNFVDDDRWEFLLEGFLNTVMLTIFSAVIGIVLGILVASVRTTYDNNIETLKKNKGLGYYVFSIVNAICKIYLTVVRGTPVVVQLLIMYFIVFATSDNGLMVATIAFGINSGAYVAEIFRGGIMSIDKGQLEAGRSLGFNYFQTMMFIILPQAIKNVLPTLLNEFIALLKETSVAGYVGIMDLTKAGNNIRNHTYSPFMPLVAVAVVYLVLVVVLTNLVGRLERRLRKSER